MVLNLNGMASISTFTSLSPKMNVICVSLSSESVTVIVYSCPIMSLMYFSFAPHEPKISESRFVVALDSNPLVLFLNTILYG